MINWLKSFIRKSKENSELDLSNNKRQENNTTKNYYMRHYKSVNLYGIVTSDMTIGYDDAKSLRAELNKFHDLDLRFCYEEQGKTKKFVRKNNHYL